jgi:cytosine/uracil/thiamine/allantoin permease
MKSLLSFMLIFLVTLLSSCEVIGGIFKAGVWVGVLIVAAIVGLIIFLIGKSRK